MPKMNGLELCNCLAEFNIPVIMVTAMVDEFTKETPYQVRAVDFITKPFSLENFKARVNKVLNKKQDAPFEIAGQQFYRGESIIYAGENYRAAANSFLAQIPANYPVVVITDQPLPGSQAVMLYAGRENFLSDLIKASDLVGQNIIEKNGGLRILLNFPLEERELVRVLNSSNLALGDVTTIYFNARAQQDDLFDEVRVC